MSSRLNFLRSCVLFIAVLPMLFIWTVGNAGASSRSSQQRCLCVRAKLPITRAYCPATLSELILKIKQINKFHYGIFLLYRTHKGDNRAIQL